MCKPPKNISSFNYTYDEDGTTIKYHLNPLNQRIAKEVNGVIVEKYFWENLTTLLAVLDADDNVVQRYNYSDERVPTSLTQDNQTYYLHYDQVGTLRLVTDANNNIVKEITYDTYGNILSDTNPNFKVPFGFAGGLHDRNTNLVHFGYREYDPYTAKWTTKDPIDFSGGDTNLYGYVLNDPVNFVDPEGLWSLSFDVYFGRGGGLTFGNGTNGWFLDYRFGIGLGGGLSFNPIDNGLGLSGDGTYLGLQCSANANFGGSSLSVSGTYGMTANQQYFISNQSGVSYTQGGWGLNIGYSAGVVGGFY
ncbi:RHS repeat-associated core domain-containing protein [Sulfurimonas lithotrophica]|uniref:RHS repeat-associated core domain-containing protein n=1 Tax=Sulfurimonas lithotrophica TaxID=2590022 RepID=A0A5P8NZD6_9BACT|nr:RHS repeat-associated core domain-containing protein [Sulfurimonas lithotrophica]QFR48815.1 RHS repeat-associated core domain-containing protein [Sulfurimonas lithotrophica]